MARKNPLVRARDFYLGELAHGRHSARTVADYTAKLAVVEAKLTQAHACQKCGTPLTDPLSIQAGYGPECARKLVAA